MLEHGLAEGGLPSGSDANRQIRCLVLRNTPADSLRKISPHIEIVEGDVRDPSSLTEFFRDAQDAVVFHLSGIIHPKWVRDFYEVNLEGTRNILRAAARAGARRLVAVSSNSPIGCNPDRRGLFDERTPANPYMNYGKSKLQMEDAVQEVSRSGKLETVIVRPCWIYGPEQPARQTRFFRMIREGKVPIVGDGECRRSLSYVDNVCQGLLLAEASKAANGRVYWIADRYPYTMNEIIDTVELLMESEFGLEVRHGRFRLPDITSDLALMADKVIQAVGIYNPEIHVLSEMNKTIACSVAKATEDLGYDPTVSLEEGMRRSLRWCVQNGQPI